MSSNDEVIKVNDVSKTYQIYEKPQDRLKQFIFGSKKKYFTEFNALEPLSFSVRKGECVGVVGRNGSGKSTLLQILAGILTPTTGSFSVDGKISALLELGAGFCLLYTSDAADE